MNARARSPKPIRPTLRAVERKAALGAVEQPFLVSRPHRPVGGGHAAAKIDRHAERHFGDGPGEGGTRREHMDAALEAGS